MRSNSEFKQKPARLSVIAVLFEATWRTWRMRHELLIAMVLPALAVIAIVVWSENSSSLRSAPMALGLGAAEALALAFAAVCPVTD